MPDYGLKIVNDTGSVQIDSTYENYFLYASGSATTAEVPYSRAMNAAILATFPAALPPSTNLLVASHSDTPHSFIGFKFDASGDIVGAYFAVANTAIAVDWAVLMPLAQLGTPSEAYGLVVRNPSGQVVYDSRYQPVRIISALVFDYNPATTAEVIITHAAPSSGKKAYLLAGGRTTYHWYASAEAGDFFELMSASRVSATQTKINMASYINSDAFVTDAGYYSGPTTGHVFILVEIND